MSFSQKSESFRSEKFYQGIKEDSLFESSSSKSQSYYSIVLAGVSVTIPPPSVSADTITNQI